MGKARSTRGPARVPVDPCWLFRILGTALGVGISDIKSALDIVDQPFPDVTSKSFRDEYLLREVLRKYPSFDLGIDTAEVARLSFLEDEAANSRTNDRLCTYNRENPCVSQILYLASRKAVSILGRFSWSTFLRGARFGPGATTRLKRQQASVVNKLQGVPHCSRRALRMAEVFLQTVPSWHYSVRSGRGEVFSLVERDHDDFMVVPKNAKTGRTIGIAPDMNILLQLGVGRCIRERLFAEGVNLNDQSINQRRAHLGSLGAPYATLDLKSASNSVTCSFVWQLLGNHPEGSFDPTWYRVMETLRTDGCLINGKLHTYRLFSAMGNGFTFELESLGFYSLAWAVCSYLGVPPDISVYGDDIIVPLTVVDLLTEVLDWCGFRLNLDKSFSTDRGPRFRESCGRHYLDGRDVTPFYIDEPLNTPDQIILAANNIVRWGSMPHGIDGRLKPVWDFLVSHLSPRFRRLLIPFGSEDDGLIASFDVATPPCKRKSGQFMGFRVAGFTRYARARRLPDDLGYLQWLAARDLGSGFRPPPSKTEPWWDTIVPYTPQKECEPLKTSLRFRTRVVHHWPSVGPWIGSESIEELGVISPAEKLLRAEVWRRNGRRLTRQKSVP